MKRLATGIVVLGLAFIVSCASSVSPEPDKKSTGLRPVVLIDTSMGKIKAELYPDEAPITVRNFLQYVDDKYYDGTIFHRVIKGFMIQCGGFLPDMSEKDRGQTPIKNESFNGLSNKRGTLAMARTGIPDSATSQFFINVVNNEMLDKAHAQDRVGYAVFGKVTEGMDVVDKIRAVETGRVRGHDDVPSEPVTILSIRRLDLAVPKTETKDEKK